MELLLLSNSTLPGQPYLAWPKSYIQEFFAGLTGKVIFIPYAGVTISYVEYSALVIEAFKNMGIEMASIHEQEDQVLAVKNAAAIAVGGGNTFNLLKELQDRGLIEEIRTAVRNGAPYVGWSAGSNVACPNVRTTNDMPIVQPQSFDALGLIDFQINPHYTEKTIEGHGGESRDQRIAEFLKANPSQKVIGLPEGTLLKMKDKIELIGGSGTLFLSDQEKEEIGPGELPKDWQ